MALKQWSHEQMKEAFTSTISLFLFLLISILILFKFTTRTKKNLKQLPSPPRLPIIGNLHQLGTLPHRSLRNLSLKYGDMMLLQLGQRETQTLIVSSAEVAREIIKTHDIDFSNRSQNTAAKILLYGCIDIGFGLYGEDWRQKRKICVHQLLSMKRVQSFRVMREEEVAEMVSKLREASLSDASVDMSEMFITISNNIICKCAFGKKIEVNDLARKVMIYLASFTVKDYFPLLGWIDVLSGKIREYNATFKELDAMFDEVIAEHSKNDDEESKKKGGFVDILLQLQKDGMPGFKLTTNDIKALLTDMFVGASDTTSTLLEWALSELIKHPFIMKKACEEVRNVVGHKSKIEENDINEMHYLKCVVKETLRFHPPAPLLAPRETISNVKLKGYNIPEKTMVFINAWAIQRDPKFWENPEEFQPERFEHSEVDFVGQDFEFIPFGVGRRGCPGMNFGITSVEYVLANLLYCFDWKLPETNSQMQDIDMDELFGLTTSKKLPLLLKPVAFSF